MIAGWGVWRIELPSSCASRCRNRIGLCSSAGWSAPAPVLLDGEIVFLAQARPPRARRRPFRDRSAVVHMPAGANRRSVRFRSAFQSALMTVVEFRQLRKSTWSMSMVRAPADRVRGDEVIHLAPALYKSRSAHSRARASAPKTTGRPRRRAGAHQPAVAVTSRRENATAATPRQARDLLSSLPSRSACRSSARHEFHRPGPAPVTRLAVSSQPETWSSA